MIEFLIKRPIAVIMSFLLLILLGVISIFNIPVSLLPSVDIPQVEVVINNPGYGSNEFEENVVKALRNNLLQVSGVSDISSETTRSRAIIDLKLRYGENVDLVFFEVNEKLDALLSTFPKDVPRPIAIKSNISDTPSLYLDISVNNDSNYSFEELSSFVESKLKNRFSQNKSIAFTDISGLYRKRIKVEIDISKAAAYKVSINNIKNAIINSQLSFGDVIVTQGDFVYELHLEDEYNDIHSLSNIPIELYGRTLLLSEISKISIVDVNDAKYYRNDRRAISMAIIKNINSRYDEFHNEVKTILDEVQANNKHVNINITKDKTIVLQETINSLLISLIIGTILAVVISFIFLRSFKNAIIILLTVVSSIVIDIFLFRVVEITINLVSLSGLILGIGLMIDNIIIVIDNIEQHVQENENIIIGSNTGVTQIIPALISSGLTTASIFFPLIFLSGLAGMLFLDQALTVSITLISSFFVSTILLPTLYVLFHKTININSENSFTYPYYIKGKLFLYRNNNKVKVVVVVVVLIIGGIFFYTKINTERMPTIETKEVTFKINWGRNYRVDKLVSLSSKLLDNISDKIESSELYINKQNFISKTERKNVNDYETLFLVEKVANVDLNSIIASYLNTHCTNCSLEFLQNENALNSIINKNKYNMEVISYDTKLSIDSILNSIVNYNNKLLVYAIGKEKRMILKIDEEKLISYNISKNDLMSFLRLKLGNEEITKISKGEFSLPVMLKSGKSDIYSVLDSQFRTKNGTLYYVKHFVELLYFNEKKAVESKSGGNCDIIYVNTENPSGLINFIKNKFSNSNIRFEGEFIQDKLLEKQAIIILLITVILLYLILSIQFESLRLPFIILAELPIGISVGIISLYIFNQSLNIMSFIGFIIMIGVVINDSILKIDLINKLFRSGIDIDTAIDIASKRRLNSIIMTSLTTILAVIPILFQSDLSSQLQTPLIITLISGLSIGTIVSVFIIPVLYKKMMK